MLTRTVEKAARDGAFGIIVIPYLPGAIWWSVLKNATVKTHEFHEQLLQRGPRVERAVYTRTGWRFAVFDFRSPCNTTTDATCNCASPSPQVTEYEANGTLTQRELTYAQAILAHEWAQQPEGAGGKITERRTV
jgi:hypothetical protein